MKMPGIVFYVRPPTSCPEPAGQGVTASWFCVANALIYLECDLTFGETGDKVEVERMPRVVVEDVRELGTNIIGKT